MQKLRVETGGERLDKFLAERVEVTRSQLKHAKILVNGKEVKSGTKLCAGDVIEFEIPEVHITAEPEDIPVNVVFEDEWLMVINKPRGMVVHPGAGVKSGTLLNALLGRGIDLERAGIVHRLDKNTNGLLVVAKVQRVHMQLNAMFEKREVKRTYLGLVEGVLSGEGTVDKNIARDPNRRTLYRTVTVGGRNAITHYKVIRNFSKWSLVEFNLETGRTHQIRVHAKSIGHPIVGDFEYNSGTSIKGLSGQMLEAVKLSFIHPITGKQVTFDAKPSEEFSKTLDRLA